MCPRAQAKVRQTRGRGTRAHLCIVEPPLQVRVRRLHARRVRQRSPNPRRLRRACSRRTTEHSPVKWWNRTLSQEECVTTAMCCSGRAMSQRRKVAARLARCSSDSRTSGSHSVSCREPARTCQLLAVPSAALATRRSLRRAAPSRIRCWSSRRRGSAPCSATGCAAGRTGARPGARGTARTPRTAARRRQTRRAARGARLRSPPAAASGAARRPAPCLWCRQRRRSPFPAPASAATRPPAQAFVSAAAADWQCAPSAPPPARAHRCGDMRRAGAQRGLPFRAGCRDGRTRLLPAQRREVRVEVPLVLVQLVVDCARDVVVALVAPASAQSGAPAVQHISSRRWAGSRRDARTTTPRRGAQSTPSSWRAPADAPAPVAPPWASPLAQARGCGGGRSALSARGRWVAWCAAPPHASTQRAACAPRLCRAPPSRSFGGEGGCRGSPRVVPDEKRRTPASSTNAARSLPRAFVGMTDVDARLPHDAGGGAACEPQALRREPCARGTLSSPAALAGAQLPDGEPFVLSPRDACLYALGVGAGRQPAFAGAAELRWVAFTSRVARPLHALRLILATVPRAPRAGLCMSGTRASRRCPR